MPTWGTGQSIAACQAWWAACETQGTTTVEKREKAAASGYHFQIKQLKTKGVWVESRDGDIDKPFRSGCAIRQRAEAVTSNATTHLFNYFVQATKPLITAPEGDADDDDKGYEEDEVDEQGDEEKDEPMILRNVKWPRVPKSSGTHWNDVIRQVKNRWWQKRLKEGADDKARRSSDPAAFDKDEWISSQTMPDDWSDAVLDCYLYLGPIPYGDTLVSQDTVHFRPTALPKGARKKGNSGRHQCKEQKALDDKALRAQEVRAGGSTSRHGSRAPDAELEVMNRGVQAQEQNTKLDALKFVLTNAPLEQVPQRKRLKMFKSIMAIAGHGDSDEDGEVQEVQEVESGDKDKEKNGPDENEEGEEED